MIEPAHDFAQRGDKVLVGFCYFAAKGWVGQDISQVAPAARLVQFPESKHHCGAVGVGSIEERHLGNGERSRFVPARGPMKALDN